MKKFFAIFGSNPPSASRETDTNTSQKAKRDAELSSQILLESAQNLSLQLSKVVQRVLNDSQNLNSDILSQNSPFSDLLELLEGKSKEGEDGEVAKREQDVTMLLQLKNNENFVDICAQAGLASALMNSIRVLRMLEIKLAQADGSGCESKGQEAPSSSDAPDERKDTPLDEVLPSKDANKQRSKREGADVSSSAITFLASKNACTILEVLCASPSTVESLRQSLVKLLCFPFIAYPKHALHLQRHSADVIMRMARSGLSVSLIWFLHDVQAIEIMLHSLQELTGLPLTQDNGEGEVVESRVRSLTLGQGPVDCMLRGDTAETCDMWIIGLSCLAELVTRATSITGGLVLVNDLEAAGGLQLMINIIDASAHRRTMAATTNIMRVFLDGSEDAQAPLSHPGIGHIFAELLKRSFMLESTVTKREGVESMIQISEGIMKRRGAAGHWEHIMQVVAYNLLTLYSTNVVNLINVESEHSLLATLLLALPATRKSETVSAVIMDLNYTCQCAESMMTLPSIALCATLATLLTMGFAFDVGSEDFRSALEKLNVLCAALLDLCKMRSNTGVSMLKCGLMKHFILKPFELLGEVLHQGIPEKIAEYSARSDLFCSVLDFARKLVGLSTTVATELRRGNLYPIVRTLMASEHVPKPVLEGLLCFNEQVAQSDAENISQHLLALLDLIHVMQQDRVRVRLLLESLFRIAESIEKLSADGGASEAVYTVLHESPVPAVVLSSLNSTFGVAAGQMMKGEKRSKENDEELDIELQACFNCVVALFRLLSYMIASPSRVDGIDGTTPCLDSKAVKQRYAGFGRALVASGVLSTRFQGDVFDLVFTQLAQHRAAIAMVLALLPHLEQVTAEAVVTRLGDFVSMKPSSDKDFSTAPQIGYIENVLSECHAIISDRTHPLSLPLLRLVLRVCTGGHSVTLGDFTAMLRHLIYPRISSRAGSLVMDGTVKHAANVSVIAKEEDWALIDSLDTLVQTSLDRGNDTAAITMPAGETATFANTELEENITVNMWIRCPMSSPTKDSPSQGSTVKRVAPLLALAVGDASPILDVALCSDMGAVLVSTAPLGNSRSVEQHRFASSFFNATCWNMVTVVFRARRAKITGKLSTEVMVYVNAAPCPCRERVFVADIPVSIIRSRQVPVHSFTLGDTTRLEAQSLEPVPSWTFSSLHVFGSSLTGLQVSNVYMKGVGYSGTFRGDSPLSEGLITLASMMLTQVSEVSHRVADHFERIGYHLHSVVEPWVVDTPPTFELEPPPTPVQGFAAGDAQAKRGNTGNAGSEPHLLLPSITAKGGSGMRVTKGARFEPDASVANYVAAVGGPTLFYPLILMATTEEDMCRALRLVRKLCGRSWKNAKVMQRVGFKAMAFVLSAKPSSLITAKVIDCMLDFCVVQHTNPDRLLLTDSLALVHLILNHQIWDLNKFSTMQRAGARLSELVKDDFYGYLNCCRLYSMGVLSWLLMLLTTGIDNLSGQGVEMAAHDRWNIECPTVDELANNAETKDKFLAMMFDTISRLLMVGGLRARDLELIGNSLAYSLGETRRGTHRGAGMTVVHSRNNVAVGVSGSGTPGGRLEAVGGAAGAGTNAVDSSTMRQSTPQMVLRHGMLQLLITYHDRASFASTKDTQSIFRNTLKPNWFLVVLGNPDTDPATSGNLLRLLGMILEQDGIYLKSFIDIDGFRMLSDILGRRTAHLAIVLPLLGILLRVPMQYIPQAFEVTTPAKLSRLIDLEEMQGPFLAEADMASTSTPLLAALINGLVNAARVRMIDGSAPEEESSPLASRVVLSVLQKAFERRLSVKTFFQARSVLRLFARAVVLSSNAVDPLGTRLLVDENSDKVGPSQGLMPLLNEEYMMEAAARAAKDGQVRDKGELQDEILLEYDDRLSFSVWEGVMLKELLQGILNLSIVENQNPVPVSVLLTYQPPLLPPCRMSAYQTLVMDCVANAIDFALPHARPEPLSCLTSIFALILPLAMLRLLSDSIILRLLELHVRLVEYLSGDGAAMASASRLSRELGESMKAFALLSVHSGCGTGLDEGDNRMALKCLRDVRRRLRLLCQPFVEEMFRVYTASGGRRTGNLSGARSLDAAAILKSLEGAQEFPARALAGAVTSGAAMRKRLAQTFIVSTFTLSCMLLQEGESEHGELKDEALRICQYLLMICPNYVTTFVTDAYSKAIISTELGETHALDGLPLDVVLEGFKMLRPKDSAAAEYDTFMRAEEPRALSSDTSTMLCSTFDRWMNAHSEEMSFMLDWHIEQLLASLPPASPFSTVVQKRQDHVLNDTATDADDIAMAVAASKRMRLFRQIYLFTRASIRQWMLVGTSKIAVGGRMWVRLFNTLQSEPLGLSSVAATLLPSPGATNHKESDSTPPVWHLESFLGPEKTRCKVSRDLAPPANVLALQNCSSEDEVSEGAVDGTRAKAGAPVAGGTGVEGGVTGAADGAKGGSAGDMLGLLSDIAKVKGVSRRRDSGGVNSIELGDALAGLAVGADAAEATDEGSTGISSALESLAESTSSSPLAKRPSNVDDDGEADGDQGDSGDPGEGVDMDDVEGEGQGHNGGAELEEGEEGEAAFASLADEVLSRQLATVAKECRLLALEETSWLLAICQGTVGARAWKEKDTKFYNVRRLAGLESRPAMLVMTRDTLHLLPGMSFVPVDEPSRYYRLDKMLSWSPPDAPEGGSGAPSGAGAGTSAPSTPASTSSASFAADPDESDDGAGSKPSMCTPMSEAWKRAVWRELLSTDGGHVSMALSDIYSFFRLRHQLKRTALEISNVRHRSILFSVASEREADKLLSALMVAELPKVIFNRTGVTNLGVEARQPAVHTNMIAAHLATTTRLWQRGEISNFDYLMHVNFAAGRSFHDLTQYPVFPWILADYHSDVLDLNDPTIFRDLSKPMGALGPRRAQQFLERYESLAAGVQDDDDATPPFFYGTHYSCTGYVLHYLLRLQPYTGMLMRMQGGHMDKPDRLFRDIGESWRSASSENIQDVRELIPEFFCLPEFLSNPSGFRFGRTQGGEYVGDVKLPPWAGGSADQFIRLHRQALESSYVSEHLHEWIDLIFGYKQRGAAAEKACNVFVHLTYEDEVDIDAVTDPVLKNATLSQINNFGLTPSQLFRRPHPKRSVPDVLPSTSHGAPTVDGGAVAWHDRMAPPLVVVGSGQPREGVLEKLNLVWLAAGPSDQGWCHGSGGVGDMCAHGRELVSIPRDHVFVSSRTLRYFSFTGGASCTGLELYAQAPQSSRQSVQTMANLRSIEAPRFRRVGRFEGMHSFPITCAWHEADDPSVLVTGSEDMSVRVWQLKRLERVSRRVDHQITFHSHSSTVLCVHYCPSLALVVSGGADQAAFAYDLNKGVMHRALTGHDGPVIGVSVNRLNGNIFTLTRTRLCLFGMNGKLLASQAFRDVDHTRAVSEATALCVLPCPDWQRGLVCVSGHSDGALQLWTLQWGPTGIPQLRICHTMHEHHSAAITTVRLATTAVESGGNGSVDKVFRASSLLELLVGDAQGCCSRWCTSKLDEMAPEVVASIVAHSS